jgi:hypothetical protein
MPQSVLTAAQTEAQMDNDALNPTRTTRPRQVVHVTLVFDGVNFVPDTLYDTLNAGYGTVGYEKNVASRDTYIFNIAP